MTFIYHLTLTPEYSNPANWNEETMTIIEKHGAFLERLGRKEILKMAGRTLFDPGDERLFGIALIEAESQEDAEAIMSNDPAVIAGIQQAVIYPF